MRCKRIRVGVISRYFPNYRNAVFHRLAAQPDMEFEFVSGKSPEQSLIREAATGTLPRRFVPVVSIPIPGTPNVVSWRTGAVSAMLLRRYDVLILTNDVLGPDVWLCCLLSRLLRIPVCIWGQGISRPPSRFRDVLRYGLTSLATSAVYYSEGGKDYWVQRGIPAEKLFVVYNALDTDEQVRIRDSLNPAELAAFLAARGLTGKTIVTFLGRLIAPKKAAVFIDAVARAAASDPSIVGLIVGDGPQRRELEQRVRERTVGDSIRFLGECYDEGILARYLAASVAVLLPAHAGLAIQHAAVYGVPVILGDLPHSHGPEQEIVEDGKTGVYCPDEDIDAFARAILYLARNGSFRNMLSTNIRDVIDEKYNVARMAQGFIDAVHYCVGMTVSEGNCSTPREEV